MSHHRETVTAFGAPDAVGPYSHAVKAGGLLFISGQIPLDPDTGDLVGDKPGDQASLAIAEVGLAIALEHLCGRIASSVFDLGIAVDEG